MDRTLVAGLAWTGAAKWAVQILSWASTVIVARLLTPGDYGIIGMAAVYLGLVQMVSEFGLGTALIQSRDLDDTDIARIGGLSLLIGLTLFFVSALVAAPIASFFREPAVRPVVVVLSATFVVTALQVVPNALLARELRFRRLAFIESTEALGQIAVTLALALAGARYWAIVCGSIAARSIGTALLLSARRHRLAAPGRLSELRRVLAFGGQVVVSRLTWYAYSNADFVVIGRILSTAAVGAYSFGWNIASIPADKINGIINRVTMPVFAEVQGDTAALARYLVRLSEGLAYVVLPASVGMALVAPDFVRFALGERWAAATLPLQLLSLHVTVRCINAPFNQALLALGEASQPMRVGIVAVVVMPALFILGATQWGVGGVALMWLVGHPVITVPMLIVHTARRVRLPLSRLGGALWPAVAGTAVMAAAVSAARVFLPSDAPVGVRLAVAVLVGAATYPALTWALFRGRIREVAAGLGRLRD